MNNVSIDNYSFLQWEISLQVSFLHFPQIPMENNMILAIDETSTPLILYHLPEGSLKLE